jgi:hypothetical protein
VRRQVDARRHRAPSVRPVGTAPRGPRVRASSWSAPARGNRPGRWPAVRGPARERGRAPRGSAPRGARQKDEALVAEARPQAKPARPLGGKAAMMERSLGSLLASGGRGVPSERLRLTPSCPGSRSTRRTVQSG